VYALKNRHTMFKCGQSPCVCKKKAKVKLARGKEREIRHIVSTSFWSTDGKPISADEFLSNLFGDLPKLFKDEEELRKLGAIRRRERHYWRSWTLPFPKSDLQILQVVG
jgi:type I restriction enzyme R subunit